MNADLQARHFLPLPQFVPPLRARALAQTLLRHHALTPLAPDALVPGAPSVYDFLPFVRLMVEKIPQVEEAVGERVLPTYTLRVCTGAATPCASMKTVTPANSACR